MTDDDVPNSPPLGSRILDLGECEKTGSRHIVAVDDDDNVVGHGHARRLQHGKPIGPGEVLVQTGEGGRVISKTKLGGDGPAQVATATYRNNYDSIFGKKKPNREMN